MKEPSGTTMEDHVLVLAPTGGDAAALCQVLDDAGVETVACESDTDLCRRIGEGAAAAIIADEALTDDAVRNLVFELAAQPEWSDFPLVVMTGRRDEQERMWSLLEKLTSSSYPLLLERPVSTVTLIRAIGAVLQSRRRQYQIRDQIAERQRLENELLLKVEALAESDRRKDEFLAVLGHELRNPLAAIVNGVQVLPMLGGLSPRAAEVCEMLGRQARQMTHLIDDLLDVSRISRGSIRLRVERVQLNELIRQVADEHRAAAAESGCVLDVDLPESLPVNGDPTRLRQVFGNLLHNACKFTDPGGRITIAARRDGEGQSSTVAVLDTGIGISKESLSRLFEPFSQAEGSLDRSRGGLGLGLALVRGLVELHGGAITAHSGGLGKGSEFQVKLPLADERVQVVDGPPATTRTSDRSFRILLVEDSPPVAEMIALMLQQMGHKVEVAQNAVAALHQIPAWRPQIIVSDISMPGMSGYELAERIRQESKWSDLVLIALSGYGQPQDRERSSQAGFDYHLVKPTERAELERLLAGLEQRRGGQAKDSQGA